MKPATLPELPGVATLVVDRHGRLIATSPLGALWLARNDAGIAVRHNRLVIPRAGFDLTSAIAAAVGTAEASQCARSELRLGSVLIRVSSTHGVSDSFGRAAGDVVITISGAAVDDLGIQHAAVASFGATRAEARIATLVVLGLDVPAMANATGRSRETIRTHVKRLMAKAGVRSQSQLAECLRTAAGDPIR